MADYARFIEQRPNIEELFDKVGATQYVREALGHERILMREYAAMGCPHTSLLKSYQSRLGEDYHKDPRYQFMLERMCSIYPQGQNPKVDLRNLKTLRNALEIIANYYVETIRSAHFSHQEYPLDMFLDIAAVTDFNWPQKKDKPGLMVVSDMEKLALNGLHMFSELESAVDESGKVFVFGDAFKIGQKILDVLALRSGYPYDRVLERGGWSLAYFVGEYVHKKGFSPHQNVLMTLLNERRNPRPMCRIRSFDKNWLLSLDFGREGWNPED